MNRKSLLKISVSLGLVGALTASSAFAIDTDTKEKLQRIARTTVTKMIPADASNHPANLAPSGSGTTGQYIGASSSSSSLGCLVGGADVVGEPLHGLVVGCSFYDYQSNGSIGRQIATDQVFGALNFTWMNQQNNSATQGRNVRYEGFVGGALGDGTGGVDVAGPATDPNERSGYVTMAGVSDGTSLNAHHWSRIFQSDANSFRTYVFKNETPALADFVGFGGVGGTGRIPDSIWTPFAPGAGEMIIWPQVAFTDVGGTQVAHLLMHSDAQEIFIYTRRVGLLPTDEWEPAFIVDENPELSPIVTNSRTSERVAIVYGAYRGDGTLTGCGIDRSSVGAAFMDNDMYAQISEDAGATWSGDCINMTRFPDSSAGTFRPYAHCTGIFDANDDLNCAWSTLQYQGWGNGASRLNRIMAWNEASGNTRVAADGVYEVEFCNGGAFVGNIDQPQLSECAGKLFLTFVMFAPASLGLEDDCGERAFGGSAFGAANGEIYVVVSADDGLTWDPPRNLTQSYTPDCDTMPDAVKEDCHSNDYMTTTRYGIDITLDNYVAIPDFTDRVDPSYVTGTGEYLFVQYIDDIDPGGAIQGGGGWHDNPLRSFRFGCVDIVPAAVLTSSIAEGQAIDDPTFVLPSTQDTFDWELLNTGNTALTYTLTISGQVPAGNITIAGHDGAIPSGLGNFDSLVITLNAGNESTVQHAHADVQITGNFVNGQTAGVMNFAIDYTIGDIQQAIDDSIAGCLVWDNRGSIGDQAADYLSFDLQGSTSECDTLATSYLFDGSPIVTYPGSGANIVASSMFNTGFVDSFTFRPQTDPTGGDSVINPGALDDGWIKGNSGNFTSFDSTLGFTVDYWAPGGGASQLSDDWKVVFARVCMTNRSTAAINGAYFGYGWDWDVPSISQAQNLSGFLATDTLNMMYMQGAEDSSLGCLDNDRRFSAVRYYSPSEIEEVGAFTNGGGAGVAGFQAMYTRDNASFVQAEWNHQALDSMMDLTTGVSGFDAFTTTDPALLNGTDLHMVMNAGSHDLAVNDTVYLYMAMVAGIAGDNTTTDLEGVGATLKTWSPWKSAGCCDVPGDANNSGLVTIGDVTFLIARIFAGGIAPPCCEEGDANGSGLITIGDVTYIIARIFSGGDAPICGPAGMTCGG